MTVGWEISCCGPRVVPISWLLTVLCPCGLGLGLGRGLETNFMVLVSTHPVSRPQGHNYRWCPCGLGLGLGLGLETNFMVLVSKSPVSRPRRHNTGYRIWYGSMGLKSVPLKNEDHACLWRHFVLSRCCSLSDSQAVLLVEHLSLVSVIMKNVYRLYTKKWKELWLCCCIIWKVLDSALHLQK